MASKKDLEIEILKARIASLEAQVAQLRYVPYNVPVYAPPYIVTCQK